MKRRNLLHHEQLRLINCILVCLLDEIKEMCFGIKLMHHKDLIFAFFCLYILLVSLYLVNINCLKYVYVICTGK